MVSYLLILLTHIFENRLFTHSDVPLFKNNKTTLVGVIRWYNSKGSNGILEGLNSLVQAAKARGYRTFKNLKIIIYMLTGKLDYSKVGLPT